MSAPSAADLLRSVGLLADGPVLWDRPVRSSRPGVFLVELPAAPERAPLDLALVGKWLERVPALLVDGERPTSKSLLARVARDWLPGQAVVYVGSATSSLAGRVADLRATKPGDPLPCPDGLRLHLLRGIEAARVWWAETAAPEEYEDALLDAFAAGIDPAAAAALGGFVAPFAVLRRPTGEERPTGITGALTAAPAEPTPPPSRVVELPPVAAARQVGAPAPRAVARGGSAPATGSLPGGRRAAGGAPTGAATAAAHDGTIGVSRPGAAPSKDSSPPAEAVHLTAEGYARLEAELNELRAIRRPEVVRRVATAREHGDLKENAEYHAAREELGFLDGRANELQARLRAAVVVDAPDAGGRASVGSTLLVETGGEEATLRLVGSAEADLAAGRISVASPVGKALLGASAGDDVTVATPAGRVVYRVLRVE